MAQTKANSPAAEDRVEDSTVEETIKSAKGIKPGVPQMVAGVQSTTDVTPSEADKSSAPGPYRGAGAPELEDPPVRAALPDTPVAQALVAGAGEHTPPDPKVFAPSGRPREVEEG